MVYSFILVAESDLISGVATFIACLLLPLQYGILIGIGLNMVFILKHAARPKILIEKLTVSPDKKGYQKVWAQSSNHLDVLVYNLDTRNFFDTNKFSLW